MSPYKIAFVSLGCAKNLVNTEQMMALCRRAGHTVTGDPDGADVAVLNTCGFIESAKSEAIENILELAELKKAGRLKKLLVAGCLSQRYPDDIRTELRGRRDAGHRQLHRRGDGGRGADGGGEDGALRQYPPNL